MEFAQWTRGAVLLFIEQEYGVNLSIRAVGDYLKRWGLTPQKPIKRAYEQRPAAVKRWLDQAYPAIEKRTKAEAGEIHWGDETALVNTDVRGCSYAPKGQTPVTMAVDGTRQKLSMISTVTNQGKASWMIIDGAFNHEKLIEFFAALVVDGKRAGKKAFLILDNLGVHRCKPVKAWLAEHRADIEVFCLPSDSPELNPDERLNANLKHAISTRVPIRTRAKLHAVATDHMAFVQTNPERVKSCFQDPRVKYAAWKLLPARSIVTCLSSRLYRRQPMLQPCVALCHEVHPTQAFPFSSPQFVGPLRSTCCGCFPADCPETPFARTSRRTKE